VLLILFVGLFLGIAIKPAVDWMARRGLPQEFGAALIFIAILALLGIFISFVLPLLVTQTVNLTTALADGYTQIRESLLTGRSLLLHQVVQTLPQDIQVMQRVMYQSTEVGAESSLDEVGVALGQVFAALLGMVFVFFLAVNWSVEGDRFLQTALILSNQRREFIREKILNLENRVSRYLTGMGLLSIIVGALALVGYLIIGLPNAVILAVFAGLMEAVPVIGPALGAVPAIIVALSISPGAAIAVLLVTVLIQVAENIWIFPRVMGSSLGVHPFLTLLAMLIFSTLFGLVGAFIAIPVTAVAKVLLDAVVEYLRGEAGDAIGRDRMGALRYEIQELVADIRSQIRAGENDASEELHELEDSLETIALDLDALLRISNSEDLP
jgi:predicted PurR-regulated permease PerM